MSGPVAGAPGPSGVPEPVVAVGDLCPPERPPHDPLPPAVRAAVDAATPARLFHGGSPLAYPTRDWLALRADHAAARDALHSRIDLSEPAWAAFVARYRPVEVTSRASSAAEYLARPDLGRRLSDDGRQRLAGSAPGATLAIALGDGLSATATVAHGPALVDAVARGAARRGWSLSTPVVVHRCRVGILNDLGPALGADVVVLLVGERPGLAVADSLSAYLAYRPQPGHTDAERNLVSGIGDRGTPVPEAARRVLSLVALLLAAGRSGVDIKEGAEVTPSLGSPTHRS